MAECIVMQYNINNFTKGNHAVRISGRCKANICYCCQAALHPTKRTQHSIPFSVTIYFVTKISRKCDLQRKTMVKFTVR